jgi:hypothetical protein
MMLLGADTDLPFAQKIPCHGIPNFVLLLPHLVYLWRLFTFSLGHCPTLRTVLILSEEFFRFPLSALNHNEALPERMILLSTRLDNIKGPRPKAIKK